MRNDWAVRKLQFVTLYRVFFMRVIDLELLSTDADPSRLIGQFATIFATVSFFLTIPVLFIAMGGGRIPMTVAWMFEHFLIETTMTVAGLIAVLNWDSAFPDRRDVLVLSPLPVRTSTFVGAKIAALFAAPLLAMAAFNVFSGVAWPLIFISRSGFLGDLRSWPAYWLTIVLAGGFVVFTVVTVQGLAANLLPRQLFLRVSALLQAGILCLLLSVYFLEPSLHSPAAFVAPENQRLLAWLPSYWFLGVFHQLNGSMHPALVPLARRAWIGVALATLGAGAALLLSYFRMLAKIVEQPDILPLTRRVAWSPRVSSSLRSAITLFSLRTLLRSRQHRIILSFYVGIGLAIVLGYIQTPFVGAASAKAGISVGFLLASMRLMILTILAIRVVASIPISLRANWIVRVTQVRPARHYQRAVRSSWYALGVFPALVILAGSLFAAAYPLRPILGHLVTMLFLGIILVELCLYGFQKIPFTCSYLPGKANIHFAFWACLMFFLRWLKEGANFEGRMLDHLRSCVLMLLLLALVAGGLRWLNEGRLGGAEELLFEEEDAAVLVSLKLS